MINKIYNNVKIYGFRKFIGNFLWEIRMRLRWILQNSFSQGGEDIIIDKLLKRKKKGFYIDVGAYDPTRFSNTQRFYIRGWRGINIEPDPIRINKFHKLRPEDINLNIGIANKQGTFDFYKFDPQTQSTFSKQAANHYQKLGFNLAETIKVSVRKLEDILDKECKSKQIDFLSIDTEGFDLEVLKSNNWKKFKPEVICIEGHGNAQKFFLIQQGYKKICETTINSIFQYSC